MNPAAEAAIRYTELGYRVYPVNVRMVDGKKRPSFKNNTWDPEKGAEYPTDPEEIRAHWEGFYGVAINTGLSGVVGIDVDQGPGKDGRGNLEAAGIAIDPTKMVAHTPGGGIHLLYKANPVRPAPTKQNAPVKDVDVRGVGGILFAYPTVVGHKQYRFTSDSWVGPDSLPVISDTWLDYFREAEYPAPSRHLPSDPEQLLQRVRELPSGASWDAMGPLSMKYAAICLGRGMDEAEIAENFVEAFRDRGTGNPDDAANSIKSALRKVEPWEPDDGEGAYERDVAAELRKLQVRAEAQRRHQAAQVPEADDAGDFVSLEGDDEDRRWLVDGMFPAGDFMMMYGPSRAGKSALLIDLAAQLDTGGEFMGHPLEKTRVLYVAAESANGVRSRFRAWMRFHGVTGLGVVVRKKSGLTLDNPAAIAKFTRYVKGEEFGLVIIDMVKYVAGSLEFDTNAGANGALIALNDIAQETGALVIGTHHSKSVAPTMMEGNHAALYGTSNYVMLVQREDHGQFTAELRKDKDGQDGRQWAGHVVAGPNGAPVYISDSPVSGAFG